MVKVLSFRFQQYFRPFTSYLLKDRLKQDSLVICITTSFRVSKFKNTSAMTVIFFWKMFKIEYKFT